MRALFLLGLILFLAVVGWLGVRHADDIYCRMLLNKAIHEYSTRRQEKAIQDATALLKRRPSYRPALERAIRWLSARKEFRRAESLAHDYATTLALSPSARYDLAVCSYESGDEDEATSLLQSLDLEVRRRNEFPAALVASYRAMVGGDYESALAALEAADSQFAGDLFYHSLMGRTRYERDDIANATRELKQAVELGEQNPRARLILAVCSALLGDLPGMERLLDSLESEGPGAYDLARREIAERLGRLRAVNRYVSPSDQVAHEERTLNLQLALAGIDLRRGKADEALERYDALPKQYPRRLGLYTRLGLFLERKSSLADALGAYRREADRLLLAAYKIATLDPGSTMTLDGAFWDRFLPAGSLVFDSQSMNPSVGVPAYQGWNLFASGSFSTTFTTTATGRYAVGLIARGQEAAGIWPIVVVSIDDDRAAELYINSPVFDLFEFRRNLLAGAHSVRLYYVNNAVAPGVEGDRNFILDKVIVRPAPN